MKSKTNLFNNQSTIKMSMFLILLFFKTITYSQVYPDIRESRPRVLLSENKFEELRQYIVSSSNTRVNQLYDRIEYNNSAGYTFFICGQGNDISGFNLCGNEDTWSWNWEQIGNSLNAASLVLFYYNLDIEKELQVKRINFIVTKLLEYIDKNELAWDDHNVINYNPSLYLGKDEEGRWVKGYESRLRQIADIGSILLDWGYDAIDNNSQDYQDIHSLRKKLVDKLFDLNYSYMKTWVYRSFFGSKSFENNNFVGGHGLRNNSQNMKLVLALYGSKELTNDQKYALGIRYQFLFKNLREEYIPIFQYYLDDNDDGLYGDNEGGDQNGGAYSHIVLTFFTEYFDLVSKATDNDLYAENPWINNHINQFSTFIRPNETTLHLGDDILNFSNRHEFDIISLSNHYDLNKNKWMLHEYMEKNNDIPIKGLEELLLRNNFSVQNKPASNPFPLLWFSSKTGNSIIKTSHDNDATIINFTNKLFSKNNHQHLDNNSFTIYKNGPLFIDSGVYDGFNSSHHKNYYTRSIAHNAITVYDPVEKFGDSLSNDGGQLIIPNLKDISELNSSYDNRLWKEYSKTDEFVYHVADASTSYNQDKVDSYIRKMLYIKSKDRIINIDYIKQPNLTNQLKVTWNTHFKEKPIIYNSSGVIANPNSLDIVSDQETKIERYLYNRKYNVRNGSGGEATIKTLFPQEYDTKVKLIANLDENKGCYYIYGENDTEGINYGAKNENITDGARWRMEVSSINKKRYNVLLHTIDIGTDNNQSDNESLLVSNQENSMTVLWDEDLYIFGIDYYGNNHKTQVVNLNNIEAGNYNINAFDLDANKKYYVKIDGGKCMVVSTDQNGILQMNIHIKQDDNELRILESCTISNEQILDVKVFPNSIKAEESITISVINKEKDIENKFKIYDLTGKLILSKKQIGNDLIISDLNMITGIYLLEVTNQYGKVIKKIVVE